MSETYKDTIVEDIHATRHAILASHGGDFTAYTASVSERRIPSVTYVSTPAYANCKLPKAS